MKPQTPEDPKPDFWGYKQVRHKMILDPAQLKNYFEDCHHLATHVGK